MGVTVRNLLSLEATVRTVTLMRQSLSERSTTQSLTRAPLVASGLLVLAALVDQLGLGGLADHTAALYAPYGIAAPVGPLFVLVYVVAAVDAVLWWVAMRAVGAGRQAARFLVPVAAVVSAALALLLFSITEYGTTVFPDVWGVLALLPPIAGVLAAVVTRGPR